MRLGLIVTLTALSVLQPTLCCCRLAALTSTGEPRAADHDASPAIPDCCHAVASTPNRRSPATIPCSIDKSERASKCGCPAGVRAIVADSPRSFATHWSAPIAMAPTVLAPSVAKFHLDIRLGAFLMPATGAGRDLLRALCVLRC